MSWRLIIIAAVLVLQSCARPVTTPVPPPETVVKPAARKVVILVSENTPAYSSVAAALAKQLGPRGSIRYMSGNQLENIKILAPYKDDEKRQFVSIGLRASVAAKTLTKSQVVFCQVFNYQDYELITSMHKGVSMMPSMARTFSTWQALAPDTTDIGIISGPGLEDMIQTAKTVAEDYGITLHHEIVKSDKEYQYAYKQMADKVQGYWLLPDNRVLSEAVLRDVMAFSVRNSKQVVVALKDDLLDYGGLFSTRSDYQEIAQQVLARLEQAQNKDDIPGADIVYLDKLILHINPVMVERLNLKVPEQYKKHEHAL